MEIPACACAIRAPHACRTQPPWKTKHTLEVLSFFCAAKLGLTLVDKK